MADRGLKRQRDEGDLGTTERAKRQHYQSGHMASSSKDLTSRGHESKSFNESSRKRDRRDNHRDPNVNHRYRDQTNSSIKRETEQQRPAERNKDNHSDACDAEKARDEEKSESDNRRARRAQNSRLEEKSARSSRAEGGSFNRITVNVLEDSDEDCEHAMKQVMGFVKFKSTQNTKVPGNDKLYAVRKEKQAQYRQYMNRLGGFNRPLSPS